MADMALRGLTKPKLVTKWHVYIVALKLQGHQQEMHLVAVAAVPYHVIQGCSAVWTVLVNTLTYSHTILVHYIIVMNIIYYGDLKHVIVIYSYIQQIHSTVFWSHQFMDWVF